MIRFQAAIPINTMMIPNRMMLLATFETTVTASLSKVEKYQITPAIKAEIPPKISQNHSIEQIDLLINSDSDQTSQSRKISG